MTAAQKTGGPVIGAPQKTRLKNPNLYLDRFLIHLKIS